MSSSNDNDGGWGLGDGWGTGGDWGMGDLDITSTLNSAMEVDLTSSINQMVEQANKVRARERPAGWATDERGEGGRPLVVTSSLVCVCVCVCVCVLFA